MAKKTKKQIKKLANPCYFCSESNPKLLDIHRLIEGKDGGTYNDWNMLSVCTCCHRKLHTGLIVIKGKFRATCDKGFVIIYEEDGKEYIK